MSFQRVHLTTSLAVAAVFLSAQISADEIQGTIKSVNENSIELSLTGELLPKVGDPLEIHVEVPGVGKAIVGSAKITKADDSTVTAQIVESSGKIATAQRVTIKSSAPKKRKGMKVPALVGRTAVDAKSAIEKMGLKAKFVIGIAAPKGVKPHTVYEQNPVAQAAVSNGDEITVKIYAAMNSAGPDKTPIDTPPQNAPSNNPTTTNPDQSGKLDPNRPAPNVTVPLPNINGPNAQTRSIVKLVCTLLEKHHLSGRLIDSEISKRTYQNLFENFDSARLYFLQSDFDEFKSHQYKLGTQYKDGNIEIPYAIFRRFIQRGAERVEELDEILNAPINFEIEERIRTDYQSMGYAKSLAELRERWRKRLKYNVMQEVAAGVELDEAKHKALLRYTNGLERYSQRTDDGVLESALTALVNSFDPHSTFYSSQTWGNFLISNEREMVGIGASLKVNDGDIEVVKIVFGSPAFKHGKLKPGDRIVAVGEGDSGELVDVRGKELAAAVDLIRGKPKSNVRLQVIPEGGFETRIYTIVRDRFDLQKAQSTILSGDLLPSGRQAKVGFIYLSAFYRNWQGAGKEQKIRLSAARDVKQMLEDFRSKNVDMVVLDMRENSGGSLNECLDTTSLFIGKRTALQVKGRDGRIQVYNGNNDAVLSNTPVVVLASTGTSSGAEILIGALKDYGRALIIGDLRSHGSGVIANPIDLGQQLFKNSETGKLGMLKVVMQRFYRPSGKSTQMRGVYSDVIVPASSSVTMTREDSLKYAMEYDQVAAAKITKFDHGVTDKLIASLQRSCDSRCAESTFFNDLKKTMDKYRQQKEVPDFTLQLKEYLADRKSNDDEERNDTTLPNVPAVKNTANLQESLSVALDYLARRQFDRAEQAYKARRHGEAISIYEKCVQANPNFKVGHYKIAWALSTGPVRDGARALKHAQRAVELDSGGNWIYKLALAVAYAENKNFDMATAKLDEALEAAPATQKNSYEFLKTRFSNNQAYPQSQ